jgi:DNA-binding MarR family transcriptional regulator
MDKEARVHAEHPQALRLWLRLLTCTQIIETRLRSELRDTFATTLARFDLMAQLERTREGLLMNELSRRMMVTGGSVTGITDQLVQEGMVERVNVASDRRAFRVRLTPLGRRSFAQMAKAHEAWVVHAFASLSLKEITELHKLLGRVKESNKTLNEKADNEVETP